MGLLLLSEKRRKEVNEVCYRISIKNLYKTMRRK